MNRKMCRLLPILLILSTTSLFAATGPRPNVLLVSLDTVRADNLGHYGYPRATSPNLDRLSRKGVLCTNPVSQSPWTLPSHITVFTGLYPSSHGVESDGLRLPDSIKNLGELIDDLGYQSHGAVSSGYVGKAYGFDKGFDSFEQISQPLEEGTEKITASGLEFLRTSVSENKQEPFFLFLHYLDAHTPYDPPAPLDRIFDEINYQGEVTGWPKTWMKYFSLSRDFENPDDLQHLIDLYDGEIRRVDAGLGKILNELQKMKILDNTLVVIFSDHGEEFKEHKGMDHGRTLYREQLHVPLLFSCPVLFKRKLLPQVVQTMDILPTLASFLDFNPPDNTQGVSLKPLIKPGFFKKFSYQHDEVAFAETDRHKARKRARVTDEYKYILTSKPQEQTELFDMRSDPGDLTDMAETSNGIAEDYNKQLGDWIAFTYMEKERTQPAELSEEDIAHLRQIGYTFAGVEKRARKKFNGPYGLAISSEGTILVADRFHNQVKQINPAGKVLKTLGSGNLVEETKDLRELRQPSAVAFDRMNYVYIADTDNNRVVKFNPLLEPIGVFTTNENHPVMQPADVAIDEQGNAYVVNLGNALVYHFDVRGNFVSHLGMNGRGKGKYLRPVSVAISPEGHVYVADLLQAKILEYDADKEYVGEFTVQAWNAKTRTENPMIAVEPESGDLFVPDPEHGKVFRYNPAGRVEAWIGVDHGLEEPVAVAISGDGTVYVTDFYLNDVLTFNLLQDFPAQASKQQPARRVHRKNRPKGTPAASQAGPVSEVKPATTNDSPTDRE